MAQQAQQNGWREGVSYALAYLAWFAAIALSGVILLLLSSSLEQWYIVLGLKASAHKATSRFFLFFGGMAWLGFIFFVEGYFREGVAKGRLARCSFTVFAALLLALGLAGASYVLIPAFLGV